MTAYNSTAIIQNANSGTHGESRVSQSLFWTAPLKTALVANDTINMGYLPPYARIIAATFSADQLDTNGAPTIAFELGDAAVPARIFPTGTTIGRAATGANANSNSLPNTAVIDYLAVGNATPGALNQGTLIIATCTAAAATWQAGNLYCRIDYYVDEPLSVLNQ